MSKLLMTAFAMGLIVGGVAGGQLAAHKMTPATDDRPAALEAQLQQEERILLDYYRENLKLRRERAEHYAKLRPRVQGALFARNRYNCV